MELIWIPISIFAALMQAVRTAAQKDLNRNMSTMGTTYVRSLVGLPLMLVYLAIILMFVDGGWPDVTVAYVANAFGGAVAQVVATIFLIQLLSLRNFAVGTMLTKSDIVMTAMIGTIFFSESLTGMGWFTLFVILAGVFLMLIGKIGVRGLGLEENSVQELIFSKATVLALACALSFSFSYLFIREATLELGTERTLWRGAWTVVFVTGMQAVGLSIWLGISERKVFRQIIEYRKICTFIGVTSALGSIGWFTAFALENASYVRAVGQIEAVFTLAISWYYFKEKITLLEFIGILLTVAGVLMFRLF